MHHNVQNAEPASNRVAKKIQRYSLKSVKFLVSPLYKQRGIQRGVFAQETVIILFLARYFLEQVYAGSYAILKCNFQKVQDNVLELSS